MNRVQKFISEFERYLSAIRSKVNIYLNELAEYDMMIPAEKSQHRDRIIELRNKIDYYEDILFKYEDESLKIEDEIIGEAFISGQESTNTVQETEFGDFPTVYVKSKNELIDEYYEVIQNINISKRNDRTNAEKYKELAEQTYLKYALLIKRAPQIGKEVVQDQSLMINEDEYQQYVNECHVKHMEAVNADVEKEKLVSEVSQLESQYMNFSNRNSIEKTELKIEIAELKKRIALLKSKINEAEVVSEKAMFRARTVEGYIKKDYCVYFLAKLDADAKVNKELSNTEIYKYDIERLDGELRLNALSDNPDEEKRQRLLSEQASFENLRERAFVDLSKARRQRLKQEILHAYNNGSISLEDKEKKLTDLESYIVVNEAVEQEVGIYLQDKTPSEVQSVIGKR